MELLQELLQDAQIIRDCLDAAVDSLQAAEKRNLERLYLHFISQERGTTDSRPKRGKQVQGRGIRKRPANQLSGRSEQGQEVVDSIVQSEQPESRIPPSKKDNPWKRFMRLDSVSISEVVLQLLHACKDAPFHFLNDETVIANRVGDFDAYRIGDAFMAGVRYTERLELNSQLGKIRLVFQMLWFWDLVKLIWPDGSGRVGAIMFEDILQFMGPIEGVEDKVKVANDFNKWRLCGEHVDHLCRQFGPGCVFFIGEYLSYDFLKKKFTASGLYYDGAISHLTELGLKEKAELWNNMANQIRERAMQPFMDAIKQRN